MSFFLWQYTEYIEHHHLFVGTSDKSGCLAAKLFQGVKEKEQYLFELRSLEYKSLKQY